MKKRIKNRLITTLMTGILLFTGFPMNSITAMAQESSSKNNSTAQDSVIDSASEDSFTDKTQDDSVIDSVLEDSSTGIAQEDSVIDSPAEDSPTDNLPDYAPENDLKEEVSLYHTIPLPRAISSTWSDPGNYNADWDGIVDYDTNDTFYIASAEDLAALSYAVNNGTTLQPRTFEGKTIILQNDIDLSGAEWRPIADDPYKPYKRFSGTFDGNEKTIRNVSINLSGNSVPYASGFFGTLAGATIKNLSFENMSATYAVTAQGIQQDIGLIVGTAINSLISDVNLSNCILSVENNDASLYGALLQIGGLVGSVNTLNASKGAEQTKETVISNIQYQDVTMETKTLSSWGNGIGGVVGSCGMLSSSVNLGNKAILIKNVTGDISLTSQIKGSSSSTARQHIGGVIGAIRGLNGGELIEEVDIQLEMIVTTANDTNYKGRIVLGGIAGVQALYDTGKTQPDKGIHQNSVVGTIDASGVSLDTSKKEFFHVGGLVGFTNVSAKNASGVNEKVSSNMRNNYVDIDLIPNPDAYMAYGSLISNMGVTSSDSGYYTLLENNFSPAKQNAYDIAEAWYSSGTDYNAVVQENYKFVVNDILVNKFENPLVFTGIDGKDSDDPMEFSQNAHAFENLWSLRYLDPNDNPAIEISSDGTQVCFSEEGTYPLLVRAYRTADLNNYVEWKVKVTAKSPVVHTITAEAGAGGEITPTGNIEVNENTDQTFSITANNGYKIKDVFVDGISVGAVSTYTFRNVTSNHTISISFEKTSGGGSSYDYYTIKASADAGGDISPDGTISVREGLNQRFTVTPNNGYQIKDVLVDGKSVGEKTSYIFENVQRNHTIHVLFEETTTINPPTNVELDKTNHFPYLHGYPDGSFGPDTGMTRAEAVVMFSRLLEEKMEDGVSYSNSFTDISENAWYANAVGYMEQYEIVSGYPDGTFGGDKLISRAEFAVIASRFDSLTTGMEHHFLDVPKTHWARDYIAFATYKGWIHGYPDNTFRPEGHITRAEVATVINQMLERSADVNYVNANFSSMKSYSDLTKVHWAYYGICEASNDHQYTNTGKTETWTALK
ncbi:S-layer homology domain-containing protein [Anaerotignum sp.]|uniref:S-layer homology domain-containing protein n=1 Tax=Anaerotignum sp. TaxID=2039241 RepID=UPI0028AF0974|nr:S-layer homology domain-containing protein [Anaerotignum sp.]